MICDCQPAPIYAICQDSFDGIVANEDLQWCPVVDAVEYRVYRRITDCLTPNGCLQVGSVPARRMMYDEGGNELGEIDVCWFVIGRDSITFTPGFNYEYAVTAVDAAGNESEKSTVVPFVGYEQWCYDETGRIEC